MRGGDQLTHGLQRARHIAGMGQDAQPRLRRYGLVDGRSVQHAALRAQNAQRYLPALLHARQRAHHGVVRVMRSQHMIAPVQTAANGHVQRIRAVEGKDHAFRGAAKIPGRRLAAGVYHPPGAQGRAMPATPRIAEGAAHHPVYGAQHLRGLWPAGSGIIQINHAFSLPARGCAALHRML